MGADVGRVAVEVKDEVATQTAGRGAVATAEVLMGIVANTAVDEGRGGGDR